MGETYTPCGDNIKNVQSCKNECTEEVFKKCLIQWEERLVLVLQAERPLNPKTKE